MKNFLSLFVVTLFSSYAMADSPLSSPSEVRRCDMLFEYCLYSDPSSDRTTIYRISGNFRKKEVYRIGEWFRNPFLSIDGRYVVVGYGGLNLIPRDFSPELVILTVYENGKLLREIKIKEIYQSLAALEETTSHYDWGFIKQVTDVAVLLETHEGEVSLYIPGGEVCFIKEEKCVLLTSG